MPQSLIINLVTQSPVADKHLQGHSLQQLFFTLVSVVDPELGHVLQRDPTNSSYSLSALQLTSPKLHSSESSSTGISAVSQVYPISQPVSAFQKTLEEKRKAAASLEKRTLQFSHSNAIAANTSCWWRISFLDDALFGHLSFLWNQLPGEVFFLGDASVRLLDVSLECSSHSSWVSSCSYRDLYEQASAYNRNIHLHFVTPTTFEEGGYTSPLPTVEAVFQSLRKYWNRYSGLVFAPSLANSIVPTNFDIKTQPVHNILQSSLQTLIACTGRISFRVGGHGDPLITQRLNALANFTQYCPIGTNTQYGMGVIKRVNSLELRQGSAKAPAENQQW
ncbi:MAG: CRISPR system precrRNA processing endoribonuclease RAMP protein Cas6 [Cyanobacteria bacterium J06634_6]